MLPKWKTSTGRGRSGYNY